MANLYSIATDVLIGGYASEKLDYGARDSGNCQSKVHRFSEMASMLGKESTGANLSCYEPIFELFCCHFWKS